MCFFSQVTFSYFYLKAFISECLGETNLEKKEVQNAWTRLDRDLHSSRNISLSECCQHFHDAYLGNIMSEYSNFFFQLVLSGLSCTQTCRLKFENMIYPEKVRFRDNPHQKTQYLTHNRLYQEHLVWFDAKPSLIKLNQSVIVFTTLCVISISHSVHRFVFLVFQALVGQCCELFTLFKVYCKMFKDCLSTLGRNYR